MMKKDESGKYSISFEIENTRIYITLYGGFFHLNDIPSMIHNHSQFELHLILEGTTKLELEKTQILLNQSEGCILVPGIIHNWKESETPSIKSSFCFSFEKINRKTAHDTFTLFSEAFGQIEQFQKIETAEKYVADLKRILSEFYSETSFSRHKIKNYFALILMNLAEDLLPNAFARTNVLLHAPLTADTEKNLRRVMIEEYVNRNYDKVLSLTGLAKVLHLSQKQTARVFEKEFKTKFQTYIMQFRLNIAAHLLSQTDLSITEIAAKVGYKSYNGFYKLFFSQTGQTPEEYRLYQKNAE